MKETRTVRVGSITLGGRPGEKAIPIQSMLNLPAGDVEGNVRQAEALEAAGCEIVRVAVPSLEAVGLIRAIKRSVSIPLVADIHFDYRIALAAVAAGVDKIRINPGNIGDRSRVRAVADACRTAGIPIRIGVNAGSLERDLLVAYGGPTAEALVASAARHLEYLSDVGFEDIVVSIKSSDVATMVRACRLFAERFDYPQHLGVTEAGTERMGILRSAVGIGSLLLDGIGDTIRVSLTADPLREIAAAEDILRASGVKKGLHVVSCPTCGRCKIDLIGLAESVESALAGIDAPLTVAVMGCAVNGPGEAREADLGIAGGDGEALLFKHGEVVRKIPEGEVLAVLIQEVKRMAEGR